MRRLAALEARGPGEGFLLNSQQKPTDIVYGMDAVPRDRWLVGAHIVARILELLPFPSNFGRHFAMLFHAAAVVVVVVDVAVVAAAAACNAVLARARRLLKPDNAGDVRGGVGHNHRRFCCCFLWPGHQL